MTTLSIRHYFCSECGFNDPHNGAWNITDTEHGFAVYCPDCENCVFDSSKQPVAA